MADTSIVPNETVPTSSTSPNGAATALSSIGPDILVPDPTAGSDRPVSSEQLARIEDKTSRIEEKFARSEAAMQRVVDRFDAASGRMSEMALQSELAAVRGEVAYVARRVRGIPGVAALAVTAVATAVLTAVVILLLLRYVPGLAPPR